MAVLARTVPAPQPAIQTAASCRFGVATLFVAAPACYDAEQSPWTCTQPPEPRVLEVTDGCASCRLYQTRR
jgi:hypothetical protein